MSVKDNKGEQANLLQSGNSLRAAGNLATSHAVLGNATDIPRTTNVLEEIHNINPDIEARAYQLECLDRLADARDTGQTRALVHMATGLGKTTVVASDVRRYLDENPEARILFLCHQNEILEQANARFKEIIGTEGKTYGFFTGKRKDTDSVTCLFATFQAIAKNHERFARDEFDYVVVDESHHAKAETYEPTIRYFNPSFLLGVTATPDRGDLQNIRETFGSEVYSKTLAQALSEGLLAQPDYRVIVDDIQQDLLDEEGLTIADLNKTYFIPKRDEEISKIITERISEIEDPRTIIFCPSISHAERMAELIEGARAMHSHLKQKERNDLLKAFRTGEVSTLVTVDMFNEGIDIAAANAIVFMRSTQSETIFLQQLGRGLRKLPDKDSVLVLDFVANCDRLIMIEKLLHDITVKSKRRRQYDQSNTSDDTKDEDRDIYDIDFSDLDDDVNTLRQLHLGSFEFNETTRKILEIIRKIQGERLPDGWASMKRIERETGVSRHILLQAVQDFEWRPKPFLLGNRRVTAISPIQIAELLDHPLVGIDQLPEGGMLLREFCEVNNVTYSLVYRLISEMGVDLPICYVNKDRGRVRAQYLTPNMQAALLSQDVVSVDTPPEGHLSINGFAKQLGISPTTVSKIVKELELDLPLYKYGSKVAPSLGADAQSMVINHMPELKMEPIPEGYVSVSNFAKQLGMTYSTLVGEIDILGVQPENHRVKGHAARTLSPGIQAVILASPRLTTEAATDDIISVHELAQQLKTTKSTLLKIANEVGIETSSYRVQGRVTPGFTAEQQNQIVELVQSRSNQIAPEAAMTVNGIEKTYGLHARKVRKAIGELGVRGFQAYTATMQQAKFYSQEDIELILSHINKEGTGDDSIGS